MILLVFFNLLIYGDIKGMTSDYSVPSIFALISILCTGSVYVLEGLLIGCAFKGIKKISFK